MSNTRSRSKMEPATESITDELTSLNLDVKSTKCKMLPSARNLLDLPNEIIERIFQATVPEVRITIQCDGSATRNQTSTSDDIAHAEWSESWIPNLRLISAKVKTIVSLIIATTVQLAIMRRQDDVAAILSETRPIRPLKPANLLPGYVANQLTNIRILDMRAQLFMQPVRPIDVHNFPKLQRIDFGAYDIAYTLWNTLKTLLACPAQASATAEALAGDLLFRSKTINSDNPEMTRMLCRVMGIEQALGGFMDEYLLHLFDNETSYSQLAINMGTDFWEIKRENVLGLKKKTRVALHLADSKQGKQTGELELLQTPGKVAWTSTEFLPRHKRSSYLEIFRS